MSTKRTTKWRNGDSQAGASAADGLSLRLHRECYAALARPQGRGPGGCRTRCRAGKASDADRSLILPRCGAGGRAAVTSSKQPASDAACTPIFQRNCTPALLSLCATHTLFACLSRVPHLIQILAAFSTCRCTILARNLAARLLRCSACIVQVKARMR